MELLREGIRKVLTEYPSALHAPFAGHALANYIRHEFRDSIKQAAGESDRLIFKSSAGQGNWAKGPWCAIFDPVVTASAQRGYYPCYLFCEDMRGVYLSLNQGVTEAREHYRADAKTALRARAQNYRALLGNQIAHFPESTINLDPASPANDTAFYEAGNICAIFYAAEDIPSEETLRYDLIAVS